MKFLHIIDFIKWKVHIFMYFISDVIPVEIKYVLVENRFALKCFKWINL